ncbi:hypothetical protein Pan44_51220 [Caulifigura coniformis]|uniref:Glycoside hydrolase family 42 N-terminal domain-containing protein n=1 Tax=Caulifigura coniformis TaxID=2527983 RepID=A0A517SLQ3_9PLAN|nr:hypothetical protein [Caulifigura coniformis]QDT57057.1 hypothetical protein Pan44_51220 [Caulifigura coniformis]
MISKPGNVFRQRATVLVLLLTWLCLVVVAPAGAQTVPAKEAIRGKKIIEWGWDEPDTKFMRANIEAMEKLPFDGLVFHAKTAMGEQLSWEVWGDRKFTVDDFRQAIDDLKATPFQRFTDRFLRVNVTPGKVDWFDDKAWTSVLNNFAVAARIAREGGCKGFMFDTEQYDGAVTLFDYRQHKNRDARSFDDYRTKVRQRGREWIQSINREFADITILLTFGYEMSFRRADTPRDRSTAPYGLLADFLDGVLDACAPETVVVDGWEFSYPYKDRKQFQEAHDSITKTALKQTAVPEKYQRQVSAGFGLWIDHRRGGWDLENFSTNHFTPDAFESAVRSALDVSDEYVWIYSERPRWWTNEMLPQAYVEALRKARTPKVE